MFKFPLKKTNETESFADFNLDGDAPAKEKTAANRSVDIKAPPDDSIEAAVLRAAEKEQRMRRLHQLADNLMEENKPNTDK